MPIHFFMQCGPIRYRVDAKKQAAVRPFARRVVVKKTAFRAERKKPDALGSIQELYALLARDETSSRASMTVYDRLWPPAAFCIGLDPVREGLR